MREIKFRAWDKFHKKFIEDFYLRGDKEVFVRHLHGDYYNFLPVTHVEIMQYTGLKDKNGKEIYEGDIVIVWMPGMPNNMRAKQEIMFINGCFGCGDYPLKIIDNSRLEVIGNIYENPELLEMK